MFDVFAEMLKNDEKIQFTITKIGGELNVLVQPVLRGGAPEGLGEDLANLRAALAMPLYVTATADVLDKEFPYSLVNFSGIRGNVNGELGSALARIKEAGKQAVTESGKGKGKDPKKEGQDDESESQSVISQNVRQESVLSNNKSLF